MTPIQLERARLDVEIRLARLSAEVIALEHAQGWTWAGATRPLTPAESRSKVRFGALDDLHARTAGIVGRATTELQAATVRALLADLDGLDSSQAVLARLAALTNPASSVRLPLGDAYDAAVEAITQALAAARLEAAQQAAEEARAQGVTDVLLPGPDELTVTPGERATLRAQAEAIAQTPIARVLQAATAEARAGTTPTTAARAVVDAIHSTVTALSPAPLDDEARQATTRAVNAGRLAAATASPPPREVYASELLDKSTCGPCAAVDDRMYETLDAALVDYPSGGSYKDCLGGARCRGTLVFVWATESAPTLDHPGDRPLPAHVIDRTPRGPATGSVPGDAATIA